MDKAESHPDNEDAAIDALIEEFGGDPRLAILALLHDIDTLARDYEAGVSHGFVQYRGLASCTRLPTLSSMRETRR